MFKHSIYNYFWFTYHMKGQVEQTAFWDFDLIWLFYLSHTRLYREYITSSEMYSLHLTHPKWTHTRSSGQPCYSARGGVGGSVPCSRTPQSWYWRRILPPPTIPAGPEVRTHNLPVTSPTRYPLGHDCPKKEMRWPGCSMPDSVHLGITCRKSACCEQYTAHAIYCKE